MDENAEAIDSYITHIRLVVALLGNEEGHVLEIFKSILDSLFIIELRAVMITKRIFTTVEIKRQITGQTTSTPFMGIKDSPGFNKKNVKFDSTNVMELKIVRLTALMSKLSTKNLRHSNHLRPIYIKVKREIRMGTIIMLEVESRIGKVTQQGYV